MLKTHYKNKYKIKTNWNSKKQNKNKVLGSKYKILVKK